MATLVGRSISSLHHAHWSPKPWIHPAGEMSKFRHAGLCSSLISISLSPTALDLRTPKQTDCPYNMPLLNRSFSWAHHSIIYGGSTDGMWMWTSPTRCEESLLCEAVPPGKRMTQGHYIRVSQDGHTIRRLPAIPVCPARTPFCPVNTGGQTCWKWWKK